MEKCLHMVVYMAEAPRCAHCGAVVEPPRWPWDKFARWCGLREAA